MLKGTEALPLNRSDMFEEFVGSYFTHYNDKNENTLLALMVLSIFNLFALSDGISLYVEDDPNQLLLGYVSLDALINVEHYYLDEYYLGVE